MIRSAFHPGRPASRRGGFLRRLHTPAVPAGSPTGPSRFQTAGPGAAHVVPEPTHESAWPLEKALRGARRIALLALAGLVIPLALIPVSGAVIAWGEVSALSGIRTVASPAGGTLAHVLVAEGQQVRAGQVLMRIAAPGTQADADLASASEEQLLARAARLAAERDGAATVDFAAALGSRMAEPAMADAIASEQRMFALNAEARGAARAALQAQAAQARALAAVYAGQVETYRRQEALIAEERRANDALWERRFTTLQRRNELLRAAVGIEGSVEAARGQTVQASARVAEVSGQIRLAGLEARRRAAAELADVEARLLAARRDVALSGSARDALAVRAPVDGTAERLAHRAPGALVRVGEPLLAVVPQDEGLAVRARIAPRDAPAVADGGPALVRLPGVDGGPAREYAARVKRIASAATAAPGQPPAFEVEVVLRGGGSGAETRPTLRPGTPVEVFLPTRSRTLAAWLLRPLADAFARAFR